MELLEALETYLADTGQIHALARRQARLLCRTVADAELQKKARMLLLLNLAALARGAPRAPVAFLLRPLTRDVVEQHIIALAAEHPDMEIEWRTTVTDPKSSATIAALLDDVARSPLLLAPLTGEEPEDAAGGYPLLVIGKEQEGCMGFSRYWRAATILEIEIAHRLQDAPGTLSDETAAAAITSVFGSDSILSGAAAFHDRQVAAAALSLRTRFLIVSGGPGTGKTMVVTQILRTLIRAFDEIEPDRIVLCAPTGRAKARLGESIDRSIDLLEVRPAHGSGTERARDLGLKNLSRKTLHGLLCIRPDGSTKYNRTNRLSHQVIVVDEASMVDLCLFAALLEAAAPDCRILLVGDMHQLPSVEAGAVLGDLTDRFAGMQGFPTLSRTGADWTNKLVRSVRADTGSPVHDASSLVLSTPEMVSRAGRLADHALILIESYRSTQEILTVSAYVNSGDSAGALRAIAGCDKAAAVSLDTSAGPDSIGKWLLTWYSDENLVCVRELTDMDTDAVEDEHHPDHAATRSKLDRAFGVFDASRILTLAHEGQRGRRAINGIADRLLRPKLDKGSGRQFFHGQQVVLGQNLHSLDLYNGDTGMVVQSGGGLKVVFRQGKRYSIHGLDRLPSLEPAFAMTVHKAQGSEFDSVLLVLPQYRSPLLTRQIVYTGLTRAKKRVCILGAEAQLQLAIDTREDRPGGAIF